MKLNGWNITLSQCNEETIDDEMIVFVEEYHKIIVLNSTASTIWRYIQECNSNNIDICSSDIAEVLKDTFYISTPNQSELFSDIDDTISQFFQAAMILKEDDWIEEE